MPKLIDPRKTIKVKLVRLEGGEVEVYDSLLAKDIEDVGNAGTIPVLSRLIKSWNLEDDKGQILPVTPENVGMLDVRDLKVIIDGSGLNEQDFLADAPKDNS